MDFELIDPHVDASDLHVGDIVSVFDDEQEFLRITGPGEEDEHGVLLYPAYNLSTGDDEDFFIIDWSDRTAVYQTY